MKIERIKKSLERCGVKYQEHDLNGEKWVTCYWKGECNFERRKDFDTFAAAYRFFAYKRNY